MRDEFHENPKEIWQNQAAEASAMTLENIRRQARQLRAKTRRELFTGIAMAVLSIAFSVPGIARTPDLAVRLIFALAIAWTLAGQYFLHRGLWSATQPADAALSTGLAFYRREIERRFSLFRRVLQWFFGPMVLSIVAWILVLSGIARNQGRSLDVILPFCAVFGIWIVTVFILRSQSHRTLQRAIEELTALENDSPG